MEWTVFWAVFSFLAGLILGHWLNLDRDKRKEYNEVALPVRKSLLKELEDPRPVWLEASQIEWEQIEAGQWWWRRPGLRTAISMRKKAAAMHRRGEIGEMIFEGQNELNLAVKQLLRYVKLK
jgi:hypothetical protein